MAANDPLILKRNSGDTGFEEVATASGIRTALGLAIGTDVLAPSGSGASLTGITAAQIANTPAGTIAATTVQAAIDELDSGKLATGGDGSALTGVIHSWADLNAYKDAGNLILLSQANTASVDVFGRRLRNASEVSTLDWNTRIAGSASLLWTLYGSIVGTATNDNAAAGNVGEYASSFVASGSAVSLTTATGANVTSISLTAGDWDVVGNVNIVGSTATYTQGVGGITTTSATVPTDGSEVYSGAQFTLLSVTDGMSIPSTRISIASTTTVYLVTKATFSAGTMAAFGKISARRVR